MTRLEFTKRVKLQAWDRCKGDCEVCGQRILGTPEYDHFRPVYLSDDASLDNCVVMCSKCHRLKTTDIDRPKIDKARRVLEKRAGVRKSRGFRKPPEGYDSWNRRMKDD